MTARRTPALTLLLAAAALAFLGGFSAGRRSAPAVGNISVGTEVGVTYPTGERLPRHGGGTFPAVAHRTLTVYRTSAEPGGEAPDDREVWSFRLGETIFFAAP